MAEPGQVLKEDVLSCSEPLAGGGGMEAKLSISACDMTYATGNNTVKNKSYISNVSSDCG